MSFQDSAETLRAKLHLHDLGAPQVIGLVLVAIMVAVFAGKLVFDAATANKTQVTIEKAEETTVSDESEPNLITVYVVGAVNNPGVVSVSSGSRVNDAVNAAGGLSEDANREGCNLARLLNDGEQVTIPTKSDEASCTSGSSTTSETTTSGSTSQSSSSGLVNINTATSEELQTLSGVGPSTAEKIISDREANGPFTSKEDLKRVSGIGDKKYASLEAYITV